MNAHSICRNKKGSSSIMVMLIMLVLVVFGVLALMSSYSDFKLSKKSAAWHATYYALDAKGEEFVSKIDKSLKLAAKKAGNEYSYNRIAKENIKQIAQEYKIKLSDNSQGLVVHGVIEDQTGNKLGIALKTAPFSKYLSDSKPLENQKYYEVIEWKELPKDFKYEGQNELWNGEVNVP